MPSPSACERSSRHRPRGQSSGLPCGRLPSISMPSYPNFFATPIISLSDSRNGRVSGVDRICGRRTRRRLALLHGGRRTLPTGREPIAPPHDFLIPPRPALIIEQRMMQNDDAFSTLDEIAQILFPSLVEVAREIISDQHVIFVAEILGKGDRTRRDRDVNRVLV